MTVSAPCGQLRTCWALLPGEDGVVGAAGPAALHVREAGGGQQLAVLAGRPLLALRLHQHVQRVQLRGQRAPAVCVQEAFDDQEGTPCDRESRRA